MDAARQLRPRRSGRSHGSDYDIQRRGLPCSVARVEWSLPELSEVMARVLIVSQDTVGIGIDKRFVPRLWGDLIEPRQIPHEDAFKLRKVWPIPWRFRQNA